MAHAESVFSGYAHPLALSPPLAPRGMIMNDMERYEILKKEVDSIQIQLSQQQGPWYSKPSIIISMVALLFSFGTTAVSYINMHNEDIRANHREVMAIIQRITKLPIENFEIMEKHKESGPGQALSAMINQENILLATQAVNLIDRYPDSFNSTEFFSIATALATSNITNRVPELFERAIKTATTSNDYSVATRTYGSYLYSKGDITEGRRYFELALNVWDIFPERNMYFVNSTDLMTLTYWAQVEFTASNISQAQKLIARAKEKHGLLPKGPMTDTLLNQINFTVNVMEKATAPLYR